MVRIENEAGQPYIMEYDARGLLSSEIGFSGETRRYQRELGRHDRPGEKPVRFDVPARIRRG